MKITVICRTCQKPFETKKREQSRPIQKYCSSDCYGKTIEKPKVCTWCGKVFANWQNKEFCSRKCRGLASRGKALSSGHKDKLRGPRLQMRGDSNPRWRGGAHKERNVVRQRAEYINWRREVFKRDAFTCQHCFKKGTCIEAHHIKEWAKYPDLRFTVSNGLTLCKPCHRKHHANKK